jgi:hypothetical protein
VLWNPIKRGCLKDNSWESNYWIKINKRAEILASKWIKTEIEINELSIGINNKYKRKSKIENNRFIAITERKRVKFNIYIWRKVEFTIVDFGQRGRSFRLIWIDRWSQSLSKDHKPPKFWFVSKWLINSIGFFESDKTWFPFKYYWCGSPNFKKYFEK